MKYHLTLINPAGVLVEHTVNLPVEDTITWQDFVQLRAVLDVMLMNPTCELVDVTPDGMSDWYTDAEAMSRQIELMGFKKSFTTSGQAMYSEIELDDPESVD